MLKTLALTAALIGAANAQHVPDHRLPVPKVPVSPIPTPPAPPPAPPAPPTPTPTPTPPPAPAPTPGAPGNECKVSDITHEVGFYVGEITMLPAAKGQKWGPNEVATITVTGSTDNDIEAGTVKWQLYQDGVTQFISSGNRPYFQCTNKGCNNDEAIALKWLNGTKGKYVIDFNFALPTTKLKNETSPTFKLVMWGTDQYHEPYDFSASVSFGYGGAEQTEEQETTKPIWSRFRGSVPGTAKEVHNIQYPEASMSVRCQGSGQCLELTVPGGMSSPFWKANGYKYNLMEHPECSYTACSRSEYPVSESVVNNVQGYQGVTLVKWGHPK